MHQSFNILVADYRPMVVAYLRSLGADAHLAEDLAQEAFLTAYQSIDHFEEGRNFGSWIRGIARNKALMHWRKAGAKNALKLDDRCIEGIDEVFDSIGKLAEGSDWWSVRREILKECISKLSSHLREAIERVYSEGETLAEAAKSLKITKEAVAQRLSRARTKIRSCVKMRMKSIKNNE